MRIHATFLVFYNGHIRVATQRQIPFPSAIMPAQRQQRNQNNSRIPSPGEDFSDVSPTVDSDDDESVAQTQDDWTFPVVSSKAKREEYEAASEFCCKFLLTDIN